MSKGSEAQTVGSNALFGICPWCGDPILPGQPTGVSDGEKMHIGCAAEEEDNASFDRDFD